ncbi:MAG: hypothetical protein HQL51_13110 [Magnetococcales bacterium]|nr:hypothetical protein [Magnetococcales bacterium]
MAIFSRAMRLNAALTLVSVAATLILADGAAYYAVSRMDPREAFLQSVERKGGTVDRRSRWQWIADREREGGVAYPALSHMVLREEPDVSANLTPLSGISHALTALCNERGDWVSYTSDEHGFPNPPGLWPQIEAAGRREEGGNAAARREPTLMIVGDSFSVSSCVPREEALDHRVRRDFPLTVTAGSGGGDLQYDLAVLREFGRPARPDYVALLFFSNDLPEGLFQYDPRLSRWLEEGYAEGLHHRQGEVDEVLKSAWTQLRQRGESPRVALKGNVLSDIVALRHLRSMLNLSFRAESVHVRFDVVERLFSAMKREVEGWGGRMVVFYLPDYAELLQDRRRDVRQQLATRLGGGALALPFHDLHPRLAALREEAFYYRGSHYSAAGYGVVGEAIRETIAAMEAAPR